MRNPEGWLVSRWLAVTLIVVATVAAYSNSLHVPFVFDDLVDIVENSSIRHLWPLGDVFVMHVAGKTVLHARPLVKLTAAVNYAMGGLETFPYHATNLATHLLAGLTLFGIVRRSLELPGLTGRYGRAATPLALAVALFWTLHPIQTQAVTYITQRYESMMGLFYLLALYALIRSDSSSRRRAWTASAVAAVLVAMGCKEVAVSAPLILLLYDRAFLAGSFREAWARRRGMYVGLAGVWVVFGLWQAFSGGRSNWSGYGLGIPWYDYAKTQFGVILHYLRLAFWPHPLVLDYGWPVARSLGEILPGAAVVGGLAAVSVYALVRRPKWGFLGAWFFLILAPTSSVMPLADLAFIHRMYLPLAAIVVAVVLGLHGAGEETVRRRWLTRRGAATVGIGVVTAAAASLAAVTWVRNQDYRSALSIWTDTVAKAPHNPRVHTGLGLALAGLGRTEEAITHYRQAVKIKPDYAEAHLNLGLALAGLGRTEEAIAHYRQALKAKPEYAEAHFNLGTALVGLGRTDEAVANFRRALAIKPDFAEAHNNLGHTLTGLGRTDEAVANFRRALAIKPDFAEAHNNLGIALAGLGRIDEAIGHFRTSLEVKPDFAEAHNNLGIALAGLGRANEAIAHYQRGLTLAVQQKKQGLAEELRRRLAMREAGAL